MAVKIVIDSTQKILIKRALEKNGNVQRSFTQRCAKEMNPYVPYLTGGLKDQSVTIDADSISYNEPYAAKQFYTNEGNGIGGTSNGGIRGLRWDKRMWASKGDGIVKDMANLAGGKAK